MTTLIFKIFMIPVIYYTGPLFSIANFGRGTHLDRLSERPPSANKGGAKGPPGVAGAFRHQTGKFFFFILNGRGEGQSKEFCIRI